MTEKIGLIKNPLTIIAIFAGIAEVSGTIVLPFVKEPNQLIFICFLIGFPTLLVCLFFNTLIHNNKVLYAPSDYKDEVNYILVNKYNAATQSEVTVKEPVNDVLASMSARLDELYEKIELNAGSKEPLDVEYEEPDSNDKDSYTYEVIDDMINKYIFIRRMKKLGYRFATYKGDYSHVRDSATESQGIWLGIEVPLGIAKEVIAETKKMYPFMEYISLNEYDAGPQEITREIFVGGSTDSAKGHLNLKPINSHGFKRISEAKTLGELHSLIKTFRN